MYTFKVVAFWLALAWSLASCSAGTPDTEARNSEVFSSQASRVTIYRDRFGVPHVHGESDGDAAFGMAYAQAEDNFAQLELNIILSIGRSAEVFGESAILSDWVVGAFESVELSKRDYDQASPATRALLDGYAAGLNYYLEMHPDQDTRLIDKFEPWHTLALIRRMYYLGGFLSRLEFTTDERRAAYEEINGSSLPVEQVAIPDYDPEDRAQFGSNSWAASGPKIADDGAYLFTNPHLPAFSMGQVYEAHLISDDGWNFSGYSRFGFVLPYVGTGINLGWASTDNYGDQEDAWIEHFDDAEAPLSYRYGGDWREAIEWTGKIAVQGGPTLRVRYRKTHHGPVVAIRDGKFLSAKLATFDEPGWLDQWYAMTRAQNLDEFLAAVAPLKMQFGNYMYADRDGNILFVYNGAFPKKSESFDWNKPVDGSDPATEWQGYHSMDEIPQVLNPVSHYMQNTNTTPYMTSMSESDPTEDQFPAYMVREDDNARSRNARRILSEHERFDFETWESESFDTTMSEWPVSKHLIMEAFEQTKGNDEQRSARINEVIEAFANWNGVAAIESTEVAAYVDWFETLYQDKPSGYVASPEEIIESLDSAVSRLVADWGDWRVTWGEINRAQRPDVDEFGQPIFTDDAPSIATGGVPGWSGGSQIDFNARTEGLKRRYKRGGNSYTSISLFPRDRDKKVVLKSVHVFGASADPESPHNMDQARLLANKQYKDAWLYLDDVQNGAVRSYHPGME